MKKYLIVFVACMIDHCIQFLDEFNGASNTKYSKEEAIAEMRKYFPKLKRWKTAE